MNAPVIDLSERIARADVVGAERSLIRATPYVWRDPETIPEREWLYGRTLLRGSLSLLVAPGASGKTALTVGMALALVSGRDLLGQRIWKGPSRVWLWNLEDSADEMDRLIQAGCKYWGLTVDDLEGRLFRDSALSGAGLILADKVSGVRIPERDAFTAELAAKRIDVTILDPLVSAHRLPENDNGKIDELAKSLTVVAEQTHSSILVVHHTAKLRGTEAGAESARGASALVNAARLVVAINRMSSDEASRFGVDGETRRRFIRVYDDKGNRSPPADASDWLMLESVLLNNGASGGEGDSLPVLVPWSPPDAFDGVTVGDLRRVQGVIASGTWAKNSGSATWAGHAVAQAMRLDADDVAAKARIKSLLGQWIANGALRVETMKSKETNYRVTPVVVVGEATCRPRREARTPCGDLKLGRNASILHFVAYQPITNGALAAAESDMRLLTQAAIEKRTLQQCIDFRMLSA